MDFLEEYKTFDKKLREIAKIYANVMQDTEHSTIMSAYYSPSSSNENFYISYGPSSPGMGGHASLPISLVYEEDYVEKTKELALLKLKKIKEAKEKNTCKTCGNEIDRKLQVYGYGEEYGFRANW